MDKKKMLIDLLEQGDFQDDILSEIIDILKEPMKGHEKEEEKIDHKEEKVTHENDNDKAKAIFGGY